MVVFRTRGGYRARATLSAVDRPRSYRFWCWVWPSWLAEARDADAGVMCASRAKDAHAWGFKCDDSVSATRALGTSVKIQYVYGYRRLIRRARLAMVYARDADVV